MDKVQRHTTSSGVVITSLPITKIVLLKVPNKGAVVVTETEWREIITYGFAILSDIERRRRTQ